MLIKLTPGVLPFCLKTLQKKIIRKKLWNISDKNGRGLGSIYSSKAAHKVSLNTDSCNLPEAIELSPIGANYNLDNSNQHSRLLLAFKEQNCQMMENSTSNLIIQIQIKSEFRSRLMLFANSWATLVPQTSHFNHISDQFPAHHSPSTTSSAMETRSPSWTVRTPTRCQSHQKSQTVL